MVADPCTSQLVPGLYGDSQGLLARVRSTISKVGSGTDTCGYVIWCPDYHDAETNASGGDPPGNLFTYKSVLSSTQPTNTTAAPYGEVASSLYFTPAAVVTGQSCNAQDPAATLLEADLVQDARVLSSCMSVTFTGKMSDASGSICSVQAIPLSTLLTGGAGGNPISVDEFFQMSGNAGRFGTDTIEVVSRLSDESHHFRDELDGPLKVGTFGASITSTTEIGEAQQPVFYGFAWRGLDSAANNPITLELYKNIEWRPAPVSGLTHNPPITMHAQSLVKLVQQQLDRHAPSWGMRLKQGLGILNGSVGSTIAKIAATGVSGFMGNP